MPQVEAWERVFVRAEFLTSTHGNLGCTACHKGNPEKFTKTDAHTDLVPYPSLSDAETYCGPCHSQQVSSFETSLHLTQEGYHQRFEVRSGGMDLRTDDAMVAGFTKDCAKCHATCGECHISKPRSVNGGLVSGHTFRRTPSQSNNCTACHGSRVGEEYTGAHSDKGIFMDVHSSKGYDCMFCHDGHEMHGDGNPYDYRYIEDSQIIAKCEDCHADVATSNSYHNQHWSGSGSKLSCQTCHSQAYKNCNGCHVNGEGITGSSYLTFKIGKNYLKSATRPYDFTPVRHIPIVPDTYDNWGGSISLANFTAEPTWKYATPHNIQRWTVMTDTTGGVSCGRGTCHNVGTFLGNSDKYFLREDSLTIGVSDPSLQQFLDQEKAANQNVVVPKR
ncbi:MAG: hypothetical protein AB7T22_01595 [Calditrichaceae bacterium]